MKLYLQAVIFLIIFVLALKVSAQSGIQQAGNITSVNINGQHVDITLDNASAQISVYTPSIIRVRIDKKQLGIDFSYAVVGKPQQVKTNVTQNESELVITTDSVKAIIQKKPFAITFYTPDGNVISQDETRLTTSWAGEAVTTYKRMQEWEHFVGLGEKTGNLDRKGSGFTNWNSDVFGYPATQDPLYSSIPFYIGIHHGLNYGIFLDNTWQTDFNFGASNNRFSSFSARGGEMNYYLIYHKNVADIINSYTWLTGRMQLPPLWSLGYQQNRYSYYPESEVLRVANTLREKRIPADGITLDIHYMEAYKLFTWDKNRFPAPLKMNTELNRLGFKTTVIVDPGIKVEKGAGAYERGVNDGVYIKYPDGQAYTGQVWPGWCNFPDFTSAKARAWWKNEVKFFAQSGVSGIWNDMNEIATWGQKMPDNVLFDYDGLKANHLQAHNVYGLQMIRASYEGARQHMKERPFLLTRSGFAGLQRYAALWTGDNRSEENHMLAGVRLLSSLGLSGVAFSGMDIGGFTGNPTVSLYTRWMELGAFTPYFRNHTQYNTKSSEPWSYGEDVLDISRSYISLRYQLLPYIYSKFYEASQTGMPVVRSLVVNYTHEPRIFDTQFQNQYLFGDAFMVAPFESTKDYGKIYFPPGKWYELYNDTVEQGGHDKIVQLNLNKLPVYVKGSSIIPMQSLVQTTQQLPNDTLTVHVYNGDTPNAFVYYEDDGKSYGYEKGEFYKRKITFNPAAKEVIFEKPEGKYKTHFKIIKLALHGFAGEAVAVWGKKHDVNIAKHGWLAAAANTDQAVGPQLNETCTLKYVIINNADSAIKVNY